MDVKISKKKINDVVVPPAKLEGGGDDRPPRGKKLFTEPYANIFLSAKKKSGKTSTIFFILKKIISKNTKLIIFCSTVHKDPIYKEILKWCDQKGIEYEVNTSLRDENGTDLLQDLVYRLQNENDEIKEVKEIKGHGQIQQLNIDPREYLKQRGQGIAQQLLDFNNPIPPFINYAGIGSGTTKEKKERKTKYKERKYIVVMDDLSDELKTPSLTALYKKNRHFKMCTITSSQYYKDLQISARKNIDYYLLWKGLDTERLESIYRDANLTVDFDVFEKLYKDATEKPYHFLYVDTVNDTFRDSFNSEYKI